MVQIQTIGDQVDQQTFDSVCTQIGAQPCQFTRKVDKQVLNGYSVIAQDGRQFFVEAETGRVYTMPDSMYICVVNKSEPLKFSFDGKLNNGQVLTRLVAFRNYNELAEIKQMVP